MFDLAPNQVFDDPAPSRTGQPTGPLQQSTEYAAALTLVNRTPLWLTDGSLVLQRRLPGGLRMAMLPRARAVSLTKLRPHLRAANLHRCLILLSPDIPDPQFIRAGALPLISPQWVAELDLTRLRMHCGPGYTRNGATDCATANSRRFA